MLTKIQLKRKTKLNANRKLIVLCGLASGLYPLIYLYSSNFALISSLHQFFAFSAIFLALPTILLVSLYYGSQFFKIGNDKTLLVFTFLNLSICCCLLLYATYGFNKKVIVILIFVSFLLALIFSNYLDKIVRFQFLLAFVGLLFLMPTLIGCMKYKNDWYADTTKAIQPEFKKKPNIYLIQPDGYVGFSQVNRGFYNYNIEGFRSFLESQDFTLYPNFRSNYYSTLSSNSSLFTMNHHFYGYTNSDKELLFARNVIVGENPVLSILKNNGYTTNLILENGFLLVNRPRIAYDTYNISLDEIPILSNGFDINKSVNVSLQESISKSSEQPQFYFIERILPGHISTYKPHSKGKEIERLNYLEELAEANKWLTEIVNLITKQDPNSLVIIAADHGGFVGYDYSAQSIETPNSDDHIYSMFSSLLAIKWPAEKPDYKDELLSSVNLFRFLFSYLSQDSTILKTLQDDKSYLKLNDDINDGLFEVLDKSGTVLKKIDH